MPKVTFRLSDDDIEAILDWSKEIPQNKKFRVTLEFFNSEEDINGFLSATCSDIEIH